MLPFLPRVGKPGLLLVYNCVPLIGLILRAFDCPALPLLTRRCLVLVGVDALKFGDAG